DLVSHRYAHCEVLIVGAGEAGRAAAARVGADERLIVVDDHDEITWAGDLADRPETTILKDATAIGRYDANLVLVIERHGGGRGETLWHVRARRMIVATGAVERPIVFRNNDRPGIMLAGAVRAYLTRFAVAAGRRAVVF